MNTDGLRRSMYEYIIYRSFDGIMRLSDTPLMTSSSRELRRRIDERLASQGLSLDQATDIDVRTFMDAVQSVTGEYFPPETQPFDFTTDLGRSTYNRLYSEFTNMVGMDIPDGQGGVITAVPGELGPRLPISPYDPRFSHRATVLSSGSSLLFVTEDDVAVYGDGSPANIAALRTPDLMLKKDTGNGNLREVGMAFSPEDRLGLGELRVRMTQSEFDAIKDNFSSDQEISASALERSIAILDALSDEGLTYTIGVPREDRPGQVVAYINGTGIDVRILDAENDAFIGRVYDNGVETYFMTTEKRSDGVLESFRQMTPQDAVNLVNFARGKEVERTDGHGIVGHQRIRRANNTPPRNEVYQSRVFSSVYGDVPGTNAKVMIQRRVTNSRSFGQAFRNASEAEAFLKDAILDARQSLYSHLDPERLIQEFADHREEVEAGLYTPQFDGDAEISRLQQEYWSVLTGANDTLLRPGIASDEYLALLNDDGLEVQTEEEQRAHRLRMDGLRFHGEPADQVRLHAVASMDALVGTFDLHNEPTFENIGGEDRRFDPTRVAKYMQGRGGMILNLNDVVSAMRKADISPDELLGDEFSTQRIRNQMIKFDPQTAVDMNQSSDPFIRRMGDVVTASLERAGMSVDSVRIDDQGIVHYSGSRATTMRHNPDDMHHIEGEIGQIFVPRQDGLVETKYAGQENYLFAPGYTASVARQLPGENKSLEERTVVHGYEELLIDQIEYRISQDLIINAHRDEIGVPTNLNNVYSKLYTTRHPLNFLEYSAEEGLDQEWRQAIIDTEKRRVRYSNEFAEESTLSADYFARKYDGFDELNDNSRSPYVLTGMRNMAILDSAGDGYFDPVLTSDGVNQGIVRFLVESASIGDDNRIVRGDVDDRTPLMKHPDMAYARFSPWDRQRMTGSNLLQAAAVSQPSKVALMTFGGWTADDPIVISKAFAEANGIHGADGTLRPLIVGDKMSDFHGNKGVISLIVDPEMDMERAEELGLGEAVQVFKDNPDLEVVMSPFPAVSRFNGGSSREMLASETKLPMTLPSGDVVENAVCDMKFIITHKSVDKGTRSYSDEDLAEGRGRKASAQLAWALNAQGCNAVMHECYGSNTSAVINAGEYLALLGITLDETATMGIVEERDTQRELFELPELRESIRKNADGSEVRLLDPSMKNEFGELIKDRGGDLALPFPLTLASGVETPVATSDESGPISWALPVLSSHLRSGQELEDGSVTTHEYTSNYTRVYKAALDYSYAQKQLNDPTVELNAKQRAKYEDTMVNAPLTAQKAFDSISRDVVKRKVEGKHNIFRDQIMANRMPDSATAVWTSDPRLDIDQVGMSPQIMEDLGLQDGEYVMIWRDPVLRDAGLRYMQVKSDERLTGVSINPVMDKCFDGDFDGDSVGIVKLNSEFAQKEALAKLSVGANLIDTDARKIEVVGSDGVTREVYPLNMQDSLDTKVSQYEKPQLITDFADLTIKANELDQSDLKGQALAEARQELVREISDYYQEALGDQFGGAVLQYGDFDEHIKSVNYACVETKAKGSAKKLESFVHYVGGQLNDGVYVDTGDTLHTREDDAGVQHAVSVKSGGTGVAGAYSQRGMKMMRNIDPKVALGLTYPVTQAILQAKHDPIEAAQRYDTVMGPLRDLWRGKAMTNDGTEENPDWRVLKDKSGQELQASPEQWVSQFEDMYTSKYMLNVAESINPEHVRALSRELTGPDGKIMGVEGIEDDIEMASRVATMDKLAYPVSGKDKSPLDVLVEAAKAKENIFDSKNNYHFAPSVVRSNMKAKASFEQKVLQEPELTPVLSEPELKPLVAKDTQAGYEVRQPKVTQPSAVSLKSQSVVDQKKSKSREVEFEF